MVAIAIISVVSHVLIILLAVLVIIISVAIVVYLLLIILNLISTSAVVIITLSTHTPQHPNRCFEYNQQVIINFMIMIILKFNAINIIIIHYRL